MVLWPHDPVDALLGDEEEYFPDLGKNVIYHSFEFTNPDLVSVGNISNLLETDEEGNPVYITDAEGNLTPDWLGNPQLAYENARRPRILLQPKSNIGPSRTVAVLLYKEGPEGKGRQSDIKMRRCVVPAGQTGNPYRFENFIPGAQNVSSVTPKRRELGETVYSNFNRLAKGDPEQGEAQIRMTPDGSRFYANWLEEGEEVSTCSRIIQEPKRPGCAQQENRWSLKSD